VTKKKERERKREREEERKEDMDGGVDTVKLFVGQIPKSYGEDDLKALFGQYGEIFEVLVLRDKATQTSKSCGFVTFMRKEDADVALAALHASQILPGCTNPIQVKYAESEMEKQEAKLFVGVFPRTTSEEQLRQVFAAYGQIDELTIIRHPGTGESKGYAFVKFSRRSSAQNAINCLNGIFQLEGMSQKLIVRFADTPRDKERKRQQATMQQHGLLNPMMPAAMGVPSPFNPLLYQQLPQQLASPQLGLPSANPYLPLPHHPLLQKSSEPAFPGIPAMPSAYSVPSNDSQAQGFPQKSFFRTLRCVYKKKTLGPPGANLFIYHLPQWFSDRDLMVNFSPFGTVLSAKVFCDKITGQSKCFGKQPFFFSSSPIFFYSALHSQALSALRLLNMLSLRFSR
jgi:CUG-BP- and ETR3-like factor